MRPLDQLEEVFRSFFYTVVLGYGDNVEYNRLSILIHHHAILVRLLRH